MKNSSIFRLLLVLIGAVLVQEMRKPAAERTWHGYLLGHIPYDFRLPTLTRVQLTFWNPQNKHLFTEHAFGIGWSVNLHRIYDLAQSALQ